MFIKGFGIFVRNIYSDRLTLTNDLTPLKSGEDIVAAPVAFHSFLAGLVSYEPEASMVQSWSLKS